MENPLEPRQLTDNVNYSVSDNFQPVSGWILTDERSYREFVSEGLRDNLGGYSSFDTTEDTLNFIRGVGDHRDVNSYFFNFQDMQMQSEEGFFGEMHCEKCEEDFRDELVNADEITDIDLDSESNVQVYFDQGQTDSYRPGYDKFFRELGFQCLSHPRVSLERRETWYEKQ